MRQKIWLLIIGAVLVFSTGLLFYLVKTKRITPFAQGEKPTISLSPASGSFTVGSTFEVTLNINTRGEVCSGADIKYLHYNSQQLEFQGDADPARSGIQVATGSAFDLYPSNLVNPSNGAIELSGIINPGSSQRAISGTMARLTFRVLKEGMTALSFDFSAGSTTGTNIAQISQGSAKNILGSSSGANFNLINPPTVQTPTPGLTAGGGNGGGKNITANTSTPIPSESEASIPTPTPESAESSPPSASEEAVGSASPDRTPNDTGAADLGQASAPNEAMPSPTISSNLPKIRVSPSGKAVPEEGKTLISGLSAVLQSNWLFYAMVFFLVVLIVYAVWHWRRDRKQRLLPPDSDS